MAPKSDDAHLHWAAVPSQSSMTSANRSSHSGDAYTVASSMNGGPPPSFLTSTPLGTRSEDSVETVMRPHRGAAMPQAERVSHDSQPVHLVEQEPLRVRNDTQNIRRPKGRTIVTQKAHKKVLVNRWVNEEVRLSMSKMSIMSLILGLLFLGALFFLIGFLAAVGTLKSEEVAQSSKGAWEASNAPAQEEHPKGGKGPGGALEKIAGGVVGGIVGKELAPLSKAIGTAGGKVPAPLQPFARYGIGSANSQVRGATRAVNPFAPQRGRPPQEQQPYGGPQQQQVGPQQYPGPAGYPSQMAIPSQGGYAQGYTPQQQQIMQQPPQQQYYQLPMQQQMQRQPLQQQPMPQQQMIAPQQPQMMQQPLYPQQPQYPQQMVPQQGYYR
jgi:hypothetical protein